MAISPDYFRAMGIPMRRGRLLNEIRRAQDPAVAVISRPRRFAIGVTGTPSERMGGLAIRAARASRWSESSAMCGTTAWAIRPCQMSTF